MTCQGCEQRRELIKRQYEQSKERMRLCLQRLTGQADRTEQQPNRTKQSVNSDQQRTGSTD